MSEWGPLGMAIREATRGGTTSGQDAQLRLCPAGPRALARAGSWGGQGWGLTLPLSGSSSHEN